MIYFYIHVSHSKLRNLIPDAFYKARRAKADVATKRDRHNYSMAIENGRDLPLWTQHSLNKQLHTSSQHSPSAQGLCSTAEEKNKHCLCVVQSQCSLITVHGVVPKQKTAVTFELQVFGTDLSQKNIVEFGISRLDLFNLDKNKKCFFAIYLSSLSIYHFITLDYCIMH